jgi:hypothetical protein
MVAKFPSGFLGGLHMFLPIIERKTKEDWSRENTLPTAGIVL